MSQFPNKLLDKIELRNKNSSLRSLSSTTGLVDFASNDYLGFANNKDIFERSKELLTDSALERNGATASRLLSGNHSLYDMAEKVIAMHHGVETATLFNSGFDANIGLLGSVPQRGDVILYDALVHASIREGIRLSNANAYKFDHNNLDDLEQKLKKYQSDGECYVVTESVFSMDGDGPDVVSLVELCESYGVHLIVDEAHAIGISKKGLLAEAGLQKKVFAIVITFGKGLGSHGAAVLAQGLLKTYLVNFAKSLVYSTALPPHSIATVIAAYEQLFSEHGTNSVNNLHSNIAILRSYIIKYDIKKHFIDSNSAIHSIVVPGNQAVRKLSKQLSDVGLDVRPILSPTVKEGSERLRICLHAFNSAKEIETLIKHLSQYYA